MAFYLIKPDLTFAWSDFLKKEHIEKYALDLDRIEWDPADRKFDETTLRIAFRHGYKVRSGIAIDMMDLADLLTFTQFYELSQRPTVRLNDLPVGRLMAQLDQDYARHNDELDDRIAEQREQGLRDAARKVEADLSDSEPKADLVAHWRSLGGWTPDQL